MESTVYFDEFSLDPKRRVLEKDGKIISINQKAFDLLLVLVENRGEIVGKNELLNKVWENQFVEENNLTVHIAALRKAFGEKKGDHRFIVTVPGKGYKFVAQLADEIETEITIESHKFERVVIEEEIEEKTSQDEVQSVPQLSGNNFPETKRRLSAPMFIAIAGGIISILLFGFSFWNNKSEPNLQNLNFTKLTASGKITSAALTPDAKYAVFAKTEESGESLWLRHIATGSQTEILPAKPIKYVGLTVSPDGDSIYATVFGDDMPDPQIWRIPLLGGAVEEYKDVKTGAAISFSPDGTKFAFTESRSALKETHLGIADADGTNKQILIRAADESRSFPNFDSSPVAWSPDGGEIACVVQEKMADGKSKAGILLVNPTDGKEKFISEQRWDYIGNLIWTDEENLAFTAFTRSPRQSQIWTISKKSGESRQITNDLNTYLWLAAANGNLLTVQKSAVSYIRIADFDEAAKSLQTREIFSESGYISNVAWTTDERILYSSTAGGKPEIWRMNADGGNPRQLTVNANAAFGITVSPLDGSIVFGASDDGRHSLFSADAEGKNMRRLTEGTEDVYPNFTTDGRSVIFQRGVNNKTLTLWRLDLTGGQITQLTETQASHPTVSPDGMLTAHYFMDKEVDNLWRIGLISSQDGRLIKKINLPPNATERRMRWHPGGGFLTQIVYSGDQANLLLLPVDGGAPLTVSGFGRGDVEWFAWSRDGSKIVISQSVITQDAVLIRGFSGN